MRLPTLREFVREAAGRYVAIDGRFWRTIFALLGRPGFLTREYLGGRRRRYIRPARLYLFTTLIFFAVSRFVAEPIDVLGLRADTPEKQAQSSPDKGFDLQLDSEQAIVPPALQKRWNRFSSLSKREKAEQLREGMLRYAPYAMFVLLPAFALLLKLVYVGRRRRHPGRPRLFGEHLVFAAYDHAFVFIAATAMLLVPAACARDRDRLLDRLLPALVDACGLRRVMGRRVQPRPCPRDCILGSGRAGDRRAGGGGDSSALTANPWSIVE